MGTPDIYAERCVHQQVVQAACDACVRACPTAAWRMNDDGLAFDADACDGCGLCVNACPTEALALAAPLPLVQADARGARTLMLACERAGLPAGAGITPCLYALSPGWLLRQCDAHGAPQIALAPGDCAQCPRGHAGAPWRAHWQAVSERLHSAGRPAPALKPMRPAEWQALARPQSAPDAGRRRFFGRMLHAPVQAAGASVQALDSARAWTVARLKPVDGRPVPTPLWAVSLDATKCSLCKACTRLCPTGALAFAPGGESGAPDRFVLAMSHCTGCGLCTDVCDDGALSPPQTHDMSKAAAQPRQLGLERLRCSACRVDFHRFAAPAGAMAGNGLCPACRQGRPVQHNRVVQTESAP